jgi:hypothetical protein
MTFNGSLLFGSLTFYFGLKYLFKKQQKDLYWDQAALISSFSYALLRLGCFSEGCCWGKISSVSWSVKYYRSQVMPWLGIPVHPVQLYDSLMGFLVFITLVILKKKSNQKSGFLFSFFYLFYGTGRFITEFYRGDSFRGIDILWGLSTSQLVSIILVLISSIYLLNSYYKNTYFLNFKLKIKKIITYTLIFGTSGCLLPDGIPDNTFSNLYNIRPGVEIHESAQIPIENNAKTRNALFLTADTNVYSKQLKDSVEAQDYISNLEEKIGRKVTIDDLAWWEMAPILSKKYHQIYRITINEARYYTILNALKYLEEKKIPFDVYLLSHGTQYKYSKDNIVGYLSDGNSTGDYFFSTEELKNLKGEFNFLELVYLQACSGSTFNQDWLNAGAKVVISYTNPINTNFFWILFFLQRYAIFNITKSFNETNLYWREDFDNARYRTLLNIFNLSYDKYITKSKNPEIQYSFSLHETSHP